MPTLFMLLTFALFTNAHEKHVTATYSSPIAITSDDKFVWVVNRDNNSVSVIKVIGDPNLKVAEIPVGKEPRCVAITPDDKKVFVTNMVDGTVSVIDAKKMQVTHTIKVGTEPFGCAVTPGGRKLYVANFGSDTVSVISTRFEHLIKTIKNVGPKPRGIAIVRFRQHIKNDIQEFLSELREDERDDDDAEGHDDHNGQAFGKTKVYVTQFLAQLRNDNRSVAEKEGRDDGKDGRVTVISAAKEKVIDTVVLNPLADTGFKSDGSTLDKKTVPPEQPASFTTGAFPNLLQSIVIAGNRAYLPNTASSPNGPFKFNVNVQGFLSVFDIKTDTDSGQTINMNSGVQNEPLGVRLFITNPIAIAFKSDGKEGWVVSAATNRIIRVELDGNGTPTINAPPDANTPSGIVRVEVGLNPQGIVLNSKGTRAYVENFISRDLSVVDISSPTPKEIARIKSADLPTLTLDLQVHRGHELFNTSIGPAGDGASQPPGGRMSNAGWGSCYSCHPDGLHDGVTWMFPDGPRQSISMESTFAHPQPSGTVLVNGAPIAPHSDQRALNWSAVRDEVQDFELNIRAVSGGQGLITDGQPVVNLIPIASAKRSADLDSIAAYIAFGIRAPISPLENAFFQAGHIQTGRQLFAAANCQSCHGGVKWTTSQIDFAPPPAAAEVSAAGELVRFLKQVGTFDPNAPNELKAQAGTQVANIPASGAAGFNIPSLLSVFAGTPYLHSGAAPTLEAVLENVTHRSAGTGGVDTLTDPAAREDVVTFLKSIDTNTQIFPLP